MGKPNLFLTIGLAAFALTTLLNRFMELPDLLHGFGLGIAIVFEVIGIITINRDISKLKSRRKRNLFKKGFNR